MIEKFPPIFDICWCGCGKIVYGGNRYINTHHNIGKPCSIEKAKRISKSNTGKIRTEENKKHISDAHLGKTPQWINSEKREEICKKISDKKIGILFSEEHKENLSISHLGKIPSNKGKKSLKPAWNKGLSGYMSIESRNAISKAQIGRKKSEETIEKLRKKNKGQIPSPRCGRGKRSYYNSSYQGVVCFRSSYELEYAKWLDKNNRDWLYECKTFDLIDDTYLPDFYLIKEDKWIDTKGHFYEDAKIKVEKFRKLYPNEKLDILYCKDLKALGCKVR